jgi:hypothetical protein
MNRAALALLLVVAALGVAPSAAAHGGGGGAQGYRSTVTAIRPSIAGLTVTVLDSDDRLGLRNESGKTVVVDGYDDEPYLRFVGKDVYRNVRSPATYLNEDRYGRIEVPTSADANAKPVWKQVARGGYWEWHDHRIHWMSTIPPAKVSAAKSEPHHLFDWRVPGSAGGRRLAIVGSLDYSPPPSSHFRRVFLLPLVGLGLAGGALWWWRRRPAGRLSDARP